MKAKGSRVKVDIRLSSQHLKDLRKIAKLSSVSVNDVINVMLVTYLIREGAFKND